jgi:hypothetical protein
VNLKGGKKIVLFILNYYNNLFSHNMNLFHEARFFDLYKIKLFFKFI